MQTFGEMIRERRKAKGITLRYMAGWLNVSPSYVSDIENDRRIPSEAILYCMADKLGIDRDDICVMAGRLGEVAEYYIKNNPEAVRLFRRIAQAELNAEQLEELMKKVEEIASEAAWVRGIQEPPNCEFCGKSLSGECTCGDAPDDYDQCQFCGAYYSDADGITCMCLQYRE